jgi:hypothetical protein
MDRKRSPRRRFRFSLRTLFAMVTVFALVSRGVPIVADRYQAWRARQAVRDYIRAFEQCSGGLQSAVSVPNRACTKGSASDNFGLRRRD